MEALVTAIIVGVMSILGSVIDKWVNNSNQSQHDANMANLNKENQKELMDYEVELQQGTNTMATQKGHAIAAGYSPALLYGNMSTPSLANVSGSSSGAASALQPLNLFKKIGNTDFAETLLQEKYQRDQRDLFKAESALKRQQTLESAARTAEQTRFTGLQKQLEKTIIDQTMAELELTRSQGENLRFMTQRGMKLLPGELVQQGLINEQTAANIEKIHSEIVNNKLEFTRIRHDIKRIDSVTKLNESSEALNREDSLQVQESVKRSAVGRVMEEFGLANRKLPSNLRSGSALHKALNNEQMKGAFLELRRLGFSEHEAANTVLYYCAVEPKDVTPSVVNGATRIFAAMVKK